MPAVSPISDLVKRAAAQAGFDAAGVAPVRDFPELEYFREWIEAGYAGEMRYMEARADGGELKRKSLQTVAPWAKSLIVCAVNYNAGPQPTHTPGHVGHATSRRPADDQRTTGWISRYAWSREDYHDAVMRRLRQVEAALRQQANCKTRCYVDTGPLVERVYARYAGVGWVGKNTCIINQKLGSWLFLGVILTSLELTPDLPAAGSPADAAFAPAGMLAPDRCGTCTACLEACPTDAFLGPRQLDATRCISYLTIEKRGEIPEALRAGLGQNVFGCDICQDVCPWNRRASQTNAPEFQPREQLVNPALEWLAAMSEEEFRRAFRGSPIKRAKRSGLRRNAVVAMGNSGDQRFVPELERLAADPDPVVASHAAWALKQLATANHHKSLRCK